MITDYMISLSIITILLFLRTNSKKNRGNIIDSKFIFGLISTGLASFTGGTWHGIRNILPDIVSFLLWKITLFMVGLASTLLVLSFVQLIINTSSYKRYEKIWFGLLVIHTTIILFSDNFLFPGIMFMVSVINISAIKFNDFKNQLNWAGLRSIQYALYLTITMTVIWHGKYSIHKYFNYNDIAHVILIGVIILLTRAYIEIATE